MQQVDTFRAITPVIALDDYALVLLNLLENCNTLGRPHFIRELQTEDVLGVLHQLQVWEHRLPKDWLPQELAVLEHSYPSVDVAFLFDQ